MGLSIKRALLGTAVAVAALSASLAFSATAALAADAQGEAAGNSAALVETSSTAEDGLQTQSAYPALKTGSNSFAITARYYNQAYMTCATFTPDTTGQYTFTFSGYSHGAALATVAADSTLETDGFLASGEATVQSLAEYADWSFTAYLTKGTVYYFDLRDNMDAPSKAFNETVAVSLASTSKPAAYNLSTQSTANRKTVGCLSIFNENKAETCYFSWVYADKRNDWGLVDFKWETISSTQNSTTEVYLTEGKDYTISYDVNDPCSVGSHNLTLVAKSGGLCAGSCVFPYKVVGRDISYTFCTVDDIPDQFYIGTAKTPKPAVHVAAGWETDGSTTLVEGRDYTLSYENNTAKGTATVDINGIGTFTGTKKATFVIRACPASLFDVAPVAAQRYTGSAICPELVVSYDGVTLKKGADYTVSYADNTNVGMACATIRGIGAYTGSRKFYFYIRPAQDTNASGQTWKQTTAVEGIDRSHVTTVTDYTQVNEYVCDECGFAGSADEIAEHQMKTGHTGFALTPVTVPSGTHETTVSDTSYDMVETGKWSGVFLRLSGADRYETMMQIVSSGKYATGGTVIIASGENFPDALAASALAGLAGNCPVLLTEKNELSVMAKAELEQLSPSKAYIIGGTAAVSADVEASVKSEVPEVVRLAGGDRYETALKIYESQTSGWGKTAIIATGNAFADALSIAPYAYATKSPIFLVDASLDPKTVAAIDNGGFTSVIIVGGTSAVPDAVKGQLKSGLAYVRLAGSSRYETSRQIAKYATGTGEYSNVAPVLSFDNVAVATGENFPDALAGAALCGKNGAALVLVDDDSLQYVSALMSANKASIDCGYILGGTSVLKAPIEDVLDLSVQ